MSLVFDRWPDYRAPMPGTIELDKVSRTFGKGPLAVEALIEVDLRVEPGTFLLIKGPSGSGKTTLLNLLSGLDRPTEGTIQVAGRTITGLSDRELSRFRNREIGYVFQSFYLEPTKSALENVVLPLVFAGCSRTERFDRGSSMLERVGLGHKVSTPAANLSAGQKQRVALARALVNEPSLILADEPTANLDSRTSREILDLLEGIHAGDDQTSIFLVTHEKDLRIEGSTKVWIEDGRLQVVALNS